MASPSPAATPKRKRGEHLAPSPAKFSFELSRPETGKDGSASPQSKVAHRFRGLALGSGGGLHVDQGPDELEAAHQMRKRQKPDQAMFDAGTTQDCPRESLSPLHSSPASGPLVGSKTHAAVVVTPPEPVSFEQEKAGDLETECASRKTPGTPPPMRPRTSPPPFQTQTCQETSDPPRHEDGDDIVDPMRAALTWHEDEITIYDPEDEDDDGTGINGIGFKPTPALAHARIMRRRQQMAEYRKREEGDARAKRSQRRRGEGSVSPHPKKRSPARKAILDQLEVSVGALAPDYDA